MTPGRLISPLDLETAMKNLWDGWIVLATAILCGGLGAGMTYLMSLKAGGGG